MWCLVLALGGWFVCEWMVVACLFILIVACAKTCFSWLAVCGVWLDCLRLWVCGLFDLVLVLGCWLLVLILCCANCAYGCRLYYWFGF